MWIITHDNVHEAGRNPANFVPRSRDYLERMSRLKSAQRKHVFRLMHKGREMFRGVAYFESGASFRYILRPLDEFGRSEYDCDEMQYMVRSLEDTPDGRAIWNTIHEEGGRQIDQLIADGKIKNMMIVLDACGVDSVCEIAEPDIREILAKYAR